MNFDLVMTNTYASSLRGMTMVEILIILAIASILIGLGAPQFVEFHERWQVLETARSLESTLMFARSEAIQRGGNIGIRKINKTAQGCQNSSTNQAWGCGWFVYADLNRNGSWNTKEPKLSEVSLPGNINVMHTSGGINIKFDRYGMASGLNTKSFTFSPKRTGVKSSSTYTLCMSSGGRIRIINEASCPKR